MLTSIDIQGLRGIREGHIDDLPPGVTVFVGPNGSGKSTVLEALLLAASPDPGEAVAQVVRNRRTLAGDRWLFHRATGEPIKLAVESNAGSRERALRLSRVSSEPRTVISTVQVGQALWQATVAFGPGTQYAVMSGHGNPKLPSLGEVRWLATYGLVQEPLHDVYTHAVNQGRGKAAKDIVRAIVPGLDNIEVLTEASLPVIHLVFEDHSIPVESSGDGVMALVRLAFELAARPNGSVLLEEPEVHEHPGAILQSARAILAATKRDVQVLLSTHSLDLVDALVAEADDTDLARMCVYRCALEDGVLRTTRIPGPEVVRLRAEIGDDLR